MDMLILQLVIWLCIASVNGQYGVCPDNDKPVEAVARCTRANPACPSGYRCHVDATASIEPGLCCPLKQNEPALCPDGSGTGAACDVNSLCHAGWTCHNYDPQSPDSGFCCKDPGQIKCVDGSSGVASCSYESTSCPEGYICHIDIVNPEFGICCLDDPPQLVMCPDGRYVASLSCWDRPSHPQCATGWFCYESHGNPQLPAGFGPCCKSLEPNCGPNEDFFQCGNVDCRTCTQPDLKCPWDCLYHCVCKTGYTRHGTECIKEAECERQTWCPDGSAGGDACTMTETDSTNDQSSVATSASDSSSESDSESDSVSSQCPRGWSCHAISDVGYCCKHPSCGRNEVYDPCGSSCPPVCGQPVPVCPDVCVAGCFCKKGFILKDGRCIKRRRCRRRG